MTKDDEGRLLRSVPPQNSESSRLAHKRAEQQADATLREQASLLNLTHDSIFVRDMHSVIKYWNRAAEELYGWRADEAVGRVTHDLLKTVFPAPLEQIEADVSSTGRWEGELRHTTRGGVQVVVASRWSLQRDQEGTPVAVLETNNDITERKRAEMAHEQSEEKWRAAFESNPTMYFMLDPTGTVLSVNRFGAEQLGYGVEELIGQSVMTVFYERDREAVLGYAEACFRDIGQTKRWEARKMRKDGSMLWGRETANAVLLQNRPVLLVVSEDITERKRAEEALRVHAERLQSLYAANLALTQTLDLEALLEQLLNIADQLCPHDRMRIMLFDEDGSLCVRASRGNDPEVDALATGSSLDAAAIPPIQRVLGGKATILIPDTRDDPDCRVLPGAERMRCWLGTPLVSGGAVIGLFSMSKAQPRFFTHDHQHMAEALAAPAAVAIQNARFHQQTKAYARELEQRIAELKRAEEAVRRSERELRDVIETIPAMAWTGFPDGSNAFVNRRWAEYTGLSAQDTAGAGWQTVVHPEDLDRYVEKWRTARAAGQPLEDEVRFRRAADGSYRWFLVRGVPLRDEQGVVRKWYGVVTDIEDRRRAEEALRRSEGYLSEAQRLTQTGSWAYDPMSGKTIYWSEEMFRIHGLDPQRSGCPDREGFARLIHPEDRDGVFERFESAFQKKADVVDDYRIVLPDGAVKHLRVIGHPVVSDAGDVGEFVGTAVDVTERKRAEEELRAAETRFRTYVDHAIDALFVYDAHGHIVDVNRQACESLGYTREELIGMVPFDFDVKADHSYLSRLRERLDAGETCMFETAHRRKDGTIYPVEIRIRMLRHGGEAFALALARDITDRKRADEERERLRLLEANLAHMNRVTTMGELTASLAHEVNQPIAAAMTDANTCLRWLTRDEPDLDEARQAAKRTVKDATQAAEIINRIRRLFKKARPEHELVNVNALIAEMMMLVRSEAMPYDMSIRTDLAPGLPPVMGDRVQLQQVLLNLMMNSLEATKDVDRPREITVTSRRDDSDHLQISVTDTGAGLPPENTDEIFNAFFTTKPDGTGMGLAISRSIIESHAGHLWATANAGPGATVSIRLPIAIDAQA